MRKKVIEKLSKNECTNIKNMMWVREKKLLKIIKKWLYKYYFPSVNTSTLFLVCE